MGLRIQGIPRLNGWFHESSGMQKNSSIIIDHAEYVHNLSSPTPKSSKMESRTVLWEKSLYGA